ncbi:MAG TPA: acyltransferase [Polyangiaceae bacterium]|nr:acyltransferase [Polyangiaceae bacterium]
MNTNSLGAETPAYPAPAVATPADASSTSKRDHIPELDWVKGFAILCVVCIHAELVEGSFVFRRLIDRAVLVFMVLFGISSELWWLREEKRNPDQLLRNWYVGRLSRILPGYWAMMAIWWSVVVLWRPPEGSVHLSWQLALANVFAYAPNIGTSWFVTVILQYILVYPLLRRAITRPTAPVILAIAALVTWWTGWKMFDIVDVGKEILGGNIQWPGWFYHWIFGPRALFNVVTGILVARWWRGRLSLPVTLAAVALTLIGQYAAMIARGEESDNIGPIRELAVIQLVDVPLALALLGLCRWVPLSDSVRRFLAFCGIWSWGIYLGHLLVHELIGIAGYKPRGSPQYVRALYALALFALGVPVAVIAAWIERKFTALWRARRAS